MSDIRYYANGANDTSISLLLAAIFFLVFSSHFSVFLFYVSRIFFNQIVKNWFCQKIKVLTGRKQRLKKHLNGFFWTIQKSYFECKYLIQN